LPSGLAIASDLVADRLQTAVNASCGPLPTDGRPPLCTTTENDVYGQSFFGGFYFEDDGDFEFTSGSADVPVQGVKDRQILVEEIRFAGSGDYVQLNPRSRRVNGSEVSYEDIKAGKNSGTRFVEKWTVFRLPADGGDGLGFEFWRSTGIRAFVLLGFTFFSIMITGIAAGYLEILKGAALTAGLYFFTELIRYYKMEVPEGKKVNFQPLIFV
jgi:hypothetical protein